MKHVLRLWHWLLCHCFYGCVFGDEEKSELYPTILVTHEIDGDVSERASYARDHVKRCVHCGKTESHVTFHRITATRSSQDMPN